MARAKQKDQPSQLQVESWPVEKVVPYANNPRLISEAAQKKVAASITEFGWQQPIVVDRAGVIIVGHTRLLAAKRLGMTHVPVVVADLSDAKAKAYRIADNRTGQEADWVAELLAGELEALSADDFDLSLTGFDQEEIDALTKPEPVASQPEQKPASKPVSATGDVWLLGASRLVCDFGKDGDPDAQKSIDFAIKRWQDLTGEIVVLEADARSFDQVGKDRDQSPVKAAPKATARRKAAKEAAQPTT